jgi:hypothetical protein
MNAYAISVDPKEFVTVNVANSVEMRITNLQIGVSVDVTCLVKDQNGNIFKVENVSLQKQHSDFLWLLWHHTLKVVSFQISKFYSSIFMCCLSRLVGMLLF